MTSVGRWAHLPPSTRRDFFPVLYRTRQKWVTGPPGRVTGTVASVCLSQLHPEDHLPRPEDARPPRSLSLSLRRRQRWHWASLRGTPPPKPPPARAGSRHQEALAPTPPWLCPLRAGLCSSVTSSQQVPGCPTPSDVPCPGPCFFTASIPCRGAACLHPADTEPAEEPPSPARAARPARPAGSSTDGGASPGWPK